MKNTALVKCPGCYYDKLQGTFLFGFNPLYPQGVAVLNKGAKKILDLVNDKRSVQDIFKLLKNKECDLEFLKVEEIISQLKDSGLVAEGKKIKKKMSFGRPRELGVWLHITNQCNLRCTYCYIPKSERKMSFETGKLMVDKVLYSAKKHGFKRIKFKFAGGEPLLELATVLGIKKYAQEKIANSGFRVDFVILTNGVLLTEKVCQTLKKEGFNIALSLDGLGRYHDATRKFSDGSGSFEQVKKGLESLLEFKIPFNITTTITPRNLENLPNLIRWCLRKRIYFALNFLKESPYSEQRFLPRDRQNFIKYLRLAYGEIEKNLPRHPVWNAVLDRVNFSAHQQCCGAGRGYLVVDTDGTISNCQVEIERKIGNIRDVKDPLKLAWEGWFAKGIGVEEKRGCQTCQWRYLCCGGCPLLTKHVYGGLKKPSPYCQVYQALIPEVLRLEAERVLRFV